MKKINLLLLCGVLCLGVAGCDSAPAGFIQTKSQYGNMLSFVNNTKNYYNNFIDYYGNTPINKSNAGEPSTNGTFDKVSNTLSDELLNLYAVVPITDYLAKVGTLGYINYYNLQEINSIFKFVSIDDSGKNFQTSIPANIKTSQNLNLKNIKSSDLKNTFMPYTYIETTETIVSPGVTTCVDWIDTELIMNLGNCINFKVSNVDIKTINNSTSVTSININLTQNFYFENIPEQEPLSETNGYNIVVDTENKKITIVYKINTNTYTKEIIFTNTTGNTYSKTVTKYVGDKTQDNSASAVGSYSYKISDAKILGKYDIIFDSSKSYFKSKHESTSNDNIITEMFYFEDNAFIARTNSYKNTTVICNDYYIDSNAVLGRIKNLTLSNSGVIYLANTYNTYNQTTFANITASDVSAKNSAYVYTLQEASGAKTITCSSAK